MNYDASVVRKYANQIGEAIVQNAYQKKNYLTGEDILSLSELLQVNYFVLKVLFRRWQNETLRLKSPYFDYDDKSVKQALVDFMNVLSRHVRVGPKALKPIAGRAIEETIWLLLFPEMFYQKELVEGPDGDLTMKYLENTKRYVRVNHDVLDRFIARVQAQRWDSLSSEQTKSLLEELLDRGVSWADPRPYMALLHKIVPCPSNIRDALSRGMPHAISVPRHEQRLIIRGLFGGDEAEFKKIMSLVEKADSFAAAKATLGHYATQHKWNPKAVEVQHLLKLLYLHFREDSSDDPAEEV